MKNKEIQRITGWIFECQKKLFDYDDLGYLRIKKSPVKTKKQAEKFICRCKDCKPIEVEIIVRRKKEV